MRGTVMFESGLVEVTVCKVEGHDAMVRDEEGAAYWVDVHGVEFDEVQ